MEAGLTRSAAPAISRRTVLGAAAAGGAGVAVSRLVGLRERFPLGASPARSTAARSGLDWVSPLGGSAAQVAHLLRRATFGATSEDFERSASDGFARTVDRLLDSAPESPTPLAGADDASRAQPLRLAELQQWWVEQALTTSTPFVERMTLFWHDHFTSDYRKIGLQSPFVYWQDLTWREHALGDLKSFLMAVTIDPGMLRYLDLGTSTGAAPNENYSRELMELFTLGVGNYGEDDVRAAAKALAGWREPLTPAMVADLTQQAQQMGHPLKTPPRADPGRAGVFEPKRAYRGTVTFLGRTAQFDTEAVLDRILAQPATAAFIARKVATRFVTAQPEDAYVARLADGFRRSGYQIKTLMRDALTSPEFLAAASYRALVKSPIEFMLHAARSLSSGTQLARLIVGSGQGMGQVLFDPPDVGGWPNNEAWVSSSTMLARVNFAAAAVSQVKVVPPASRAVEQDLDQTVSDQTARLLNAATDEKARWILLLASPEFQLK